MPFAASSIELLKKLFDAPATANESSISTTALSNILKYQDTKSDNISDLIETRLILSPKEIQEVEAAYPFLKRDDIYFTEDSEYVDAQGNLVHKGKVYRKRAVGLVPMIDALYLFDDGRAFLTMKDYFATGPNREGIALAINEIQIQLKERRYEPHNLDIYEALIVDERSPDSFRSMAVTHFFDILGLSLSMLRKTRQRKRLYTPNLRCLGRSAASYS